MPFLLTTNNTGSSVKNRQAFLFKFQECFLLQPKKHKKTAWKNCFWLNLKNKQILSNRDVEAPSLVCFSANLQCAAGLEKVIHQKHTGHVMHQHPSMPRTKTGAGRWEN
jgi:hypothetical protein